MEEGEELKEWPHRAARFPKESNSFYSKNGVRQLDSTLAAHENRLGKF